MSERYQPSNGTEGEYFMARFCDHCERDRAFRETGGAEPGCIIAALTLIYDVDDPEYPREWVYDKNGEPTCTAFQPVTPTTSPHPNPTE